ncbi:MAG: HAD family phosphatase [Patescibacteria group bacterium]
MKRKYTTIISDLGGVFLNRGVWLFWDHLQEEHKIPVETAKLAFLKNYKQYFSGYITEEEFWVNLLSEINLKQDWKLLREKLLGFFEINKETSDIYRNLRKKGFKMVLLCDQSKEWWPILDKKFEISSQFDFVVVSALIGLHKPSPEIYKYTLKKSKSVAKESIFTDDIDYNLTPAKDLGVDTILFENSKQFKKELQKRIDIQ